MRNFVLKVQNSSAIDSIGITDTQQLIVKYKNATVYYISDIPFTYDSFDELMNGYLDGGGSLGSSLSESIKAKMSERRLTSMLSVLDDADSLNLIEESQWQDSCIETFNRLSGISASSKALVASVINALSNKAKEAPARTAWAW